LTVWGAGAETALHVAARGGHVDTVRELLRLGADATALATEQVFQINWRGTDQRMDIPVQRVTPLGEAALNGALHVVLVLLGQIPRQGRDRSDPSIGVLAVLGEHVDIPRAIANDGRHDLSEAYGVALATGQDLAQRFLAPKYCAKRSALTEALLRKLSWQAKKAMLRDNPATIQVLDIERSAVGNVVRTLVTSGLARSELLERARVAPWERKDVQHLCGNAKDAKARRILAQIQALQLRASRMIRPGHRFSSEDQVRTLALMIGGLGRADVNLFDVADPTSGRYSWSWERLFPGAPGHRGHRNSYPSWSCPAYCNRRPTGTSAGASSFGNYNLGVSPLRVIISAQKWREAKSASRATSDTRTPI
jgi:hypothetical protein